MEALESKTYTTEKTLAERMNERLAELHMTKAEAAMRMNYSRSAVSQYLNGKYASDPTEIEKMNQIIRAAGPDILIMCLGCPKQEKYIAANREKYGAGLSVCAGATIDFLSGNVRRCPPWMSRHGLEWFYRFLQEPKRLFKRYFIDDMQIARLIWKYRGQRRPEGRG